MPFLFKLLLFISVFISISDSILLETSLGTLLGKDYTLENGKVVHSFKKIPYVEPPIVPRRFLKAQNKQPWEGIWNATEYGPACMTNHSASHSHAEWVDEDCLHLNIFTSDYCLKTKNCPVAVFLHGGDLMMDSAVIFDDVIMMNNFPANDVILVIPAFRMGFFSLLVFHNDDVIPRNLAAYDIIASLEYIQREISNFGGNPNDVTLMGHSGGAQTAMVFSLSKTIDPEKRLFQKVVGMSSDIVFSDLHHAISMTWEFAFRMNCSSSNEPFMPNNLLIEEVVEWFRHKDQFEILRVQREMEEQLQFNTFWLMIEPLFGAKDFIDYFEDPVPRPYLLGTCKYEVVNERNATRVNSQRAVQRFYRYNNPLEVEQKYYRDYEEGNVGFNVSNLAEMFFLTSHKAAHTFTEAGAPVYLYSYEYLKHAQHGDELYFVMGLHPKEWDDNEMELMQMFPMYIIDFIKKGRPHEDWTPFNPLNDSYYLINLLPSENLRPEMTSYYNKPVIDYWLEEMVQFDANITKNHPKIQQKQIAIAPTGNFSTSFWLFFVVLTGVAILVGNCTVVLKNRRKYDQYMELL